MNVKVAWSRARGGKGAHIARLITAAFQTAPVSVHDQDAGDDRARDFSQANDHALSEAYRDIVASARLGHKSQFLHRRLESNLTSQRIIASGHNRSSLGQVGCTCNRPFRWDVRAGFPF